MIGKSNFRILFLALFLIPAFSAAAADYLYGTENLPVIEYMKGTVDFLNSKAPRVVEFYSPSCGACQNYAPRYVKLAKEVIKDHPEVEFYGVSCEAHADVCRDYNINGYPSIKIFYADSQEYATFGHRTSASKLVKALKLDENNESAAFVTLKETRKLEDEGTLDEQAEVEAEAESDEEEAEPDEEKVEPDEEKLISDEEKTDSGEETETEDAPADKEQSDEDIEGKDWDPEDEQESKEQEEESGEEEEGKEEEESEEEEDKGPLPARVAAEAEDDTGNAAPENKIKGTFDELFAEKASGGPPGDVDKDDETESLSQDKAMDERPVIISEKDDEPESESDSEEGSDETEGTETTGAALGLEDLKPKAGAARARMSPKDMDKWKLQLAERKARIEQRAKRGGRMRQAGGAASINQKPPQPGETTTMKANKPGTTEYQKRMNAMLARIKGDRKKQGLRQKKSAMTGQEKPVLKKGQMPLKKDVRKRGIAGKVAMKMPVLKGLVRMTAEEQLILDATLSFRSGLRHGIFMNNEPLTAKKKLALQGWLELLSVSLPPEWGLHETIDDLLAHIDTISTGPAQLEKILDKHKFWNSNWSASCNKGQGAKGFTCGFWKLLHIMTIGMAEHRGGLNLREAGAVSANTRIFSPMEAANTVREYMAHFFGCTECRTHFIGEYDQCAFRRCDRLTDDAFTADAEDWKQLALWLWEVHNGVSVRVANERAERTKKMIPPQAQKMAQPRFPAEEEVQHLFPSIESCLACFESDGSFNEDGVFEFLEKTYWSSPDPTYDKLLKYQKQDTDVSGTHFMWFFMLLVLLGVYKMRNKLSTNSGGVRGLARSALVTGRTAIGGKKRTV